MRLRDFFTATAREFPKPPDIPFDCKGILANEPLYRKYLDIVALRMRAQTTAWFVGFIVCVAIYAADFTYHYFSKFADFCLIIAIAICAFGLYAMAVLIKYDRIMRASYFQLIAMAKMFNSQNELLLSISPRPPESLQGEVSKS